MIVLGLAFQTLTWLTVCALFVNSRRASAFHPFTYYLAFHGIVFVIRPILVMAFNLNFMFSYMRFFPTDDQFVFTLAVSSLGLLVFALVNWWTDRVVPNWQRPVASCFSRLEWRAFLVTAALLGPIGLYSVYINVRSSISQIDYDNPILRGTHDIATGIYTLTNTTGYITDAELMLGPLSLMLIWAMRFRLGSFVPLGAYLGERAYEGWARWTIVFTLMALGLLLLLHRNRRWPSTIFVVLALPLLILFHQLGQNRDTFKQVVAGETIQSQMTQDKGDWNDMLDSPDFANFDYLAYVLDTVPKDSGTYSYFTQYLQLFTEPIPRILWPEKPIGPPISLVNLNAYGYFVGLTTSLVGDGWISFGVIGVIMTIGLASYILSRFHRWFWRSGLTNFKSLFYCVFIPESLQWFRDGGISIVKVALWTLGPFIVWRSIAAFLVRQPVLSVRSPQHGLSSYRVQTSADDGTSGSR